MSRIEAMARSFDIAAPVPAGIRRPTMTFSFRPSSVSTLPLTAASVSTRVVSWKDAAEMKERVCRLALVMPSSTGTPTRGLLALRERRLVGRLEIELVDLLADQEVGVAGIDDVDLLQHLADDHLDVLVVDADALQAVDLLDLVDEIGRQLLDALDRENVVRGGIAVDDVLALLDDVAVLQMDVLRLRDQVLDRLDALLARLDRSGAACS